MNVCENNDFDEFKISKLMVVPPFPEKTSEHVRFGVDPGTTKMGLAVIFKHYVRIFEINIIRNPNPVNRILLTQEILSKCFTLFDYAPLMVIEGSSFGDRYRQTELAEVRASAVLWAVNHGITPSIIPPLKIRKQVLGNSKLKPEMEWNLMDYPNAANALCCAYAVENKT